MKKKYGEEKIHQFRRSWDIKPGALNKKSPYHPLNIDFINFKKILAKSSQRISMR